MLSKEVIVMNGYLAEFARNIIDHVKPHTERQIDGYQIFTGCIELHGAAYELSWYYDGDGDTILTNFHQV